MFKKLNKYLLYFLFCFSFSLNANTIEKKDILINGNKTIAKENILEILDFSLSQGISIETINIFQKKLYASNFFSKVLIKNISK